jgi:16S rRNA (guanine527-N7)-methyltransferase
MFFTTFQEVLFHDINNIVILIMKIILKYFPDLTDQQIKQFNALDSLYKEWNKKINVISRKDVDGLYEKHILHSLSIAAVFDFKPGTEILDIGTGGGFPGIPLAIFFPEVNFHLVDSIDKKLNVVRAVSESTGLKNINTTQIRAEEIKNNQYDFVVSRAVAPLKNLWNWSKPLLKKSVSVKNSGNPFPLAMAGRNLTEIPGLIALKGGNLETEIQESGTKPHIIKIAGIFQEEFFKEKYLLYVPRKNTA